MDHPPSQLRLYIEQLYTIRKERAEGAWRTAETLRGRRSPSVPAVRSTLTSRPEGGAKWRRLAQKQKMLGRRTGRFAFVRVSLHPKRILTAGTAPGGEPK